MADIKKSVNLLPEYLRTDKNSKFLSSTIDQLIQTPQVERIDGYVGSKITPNYQSSTDFYIEDSSPLRKNYSLEPAIVFKDQLGTVNDAVAYNDLINELGIQGSKTDNLNKLLRSKFYSYDPLIDWDKLVNYTDYYWLPLGPDVILLKNDNVNNIIGFPSYIMSNGHALSNGMKIAIDNIEYIVEGVGHSIKLINFSLLTSSSKIATGFDEKFDSINFDEYPFDAGGDRRLPIEPDYITINRSSKDLNPWSRYNRWFHKDIINITATINNVPALYPLTTRAKRPIIEFKPNLQLYNFGKYGNQNIDLIDNSIKDAFAEVDGTPGFYIDEVLLQKGNRVIFNADLNEDIRGRIFEIDIETTGEIPVLRLTTPVDTIPSDYNSVSVNFGTEFYGTSWYFDASKVKWIYAQQHDKVNQPPLFDLFTANGISFTKSAEINNFAGTQLFGYQLGTGVKDPVLGFPLKYQNDIGVGSYLFKNYFMTDSISVITNNVSSNLSTAVTYLKLDDTLINVWVEAADYQIPIIEIQNITELTNTLKITCLDAPFVTTGLSIEVYRNSKKLLSTFSSTISEITITTADTLYINDTIVIKVFTGQQPNTNGYYETPIGLTNNPLNGTFANLTLSELGDHLSTMVSKVPSYTGSNLRDLTDYTKNGTRLVVNANPISFAQIFLGKKEHNLVDAIRQANDHYSQFKMNFLRLLTIIDSTMSPMDAVDYVLTDLNRAKDIKSSYQRSDMLGYGQNKTVRTFVVRDVNNVEYPTGLDFDLNRLSFNSVIVYLNDIQLNHGKDYTFNYINGSVIFLKSLKVNDNISINCYPNTLGSYIPPTPSKLGLYPASVPEIYTDDTFVIPTLCIKGHDGSIMKAYGDYRDAIVLEFEQRVYNNIKVYYNKKLFDIVAIQPGAFRNSKYTVEDLNSILINDFSRWAGINSVDTKTNSTFDPDNSKTWNFKGSIDNWFNSAVTGTSKNLFRYFYDTQRPDIRPWEMLGLATKPIWWEHEYGMAPYSSNNIMWSDIEFGYIAGTDTFDENYARPGLSHIIPVDELGNLKNPDSFLVSPNNYQDKISNWSFGDISPAENTWRNSSAWPFALISAAALLDPTNFCSKLYDTSRTDLNPLGQVIYENNLYLNPKNLAIEGNGDSMIAGYGSYVIEKGNQKDQNYINILKQDLTYLESNLFHKLGGFASKEKLQITIDSIDPSSTSPGVILPPEDYSLILNVSNPIKTARISGIIVQKSNGKFVIKGYDVAHPYFKIFRPISIASSGAVKVGGVSEEFSDWSYVANNGNAGLSSVDLTSASGPTTRYYKQGQLIRYGNKFYRVKAGHVAESTFDSTLYVPLPSLPIVGGAEAQLPASFEKTITQIPYGTELSTVQEVYDIIVGYGEYLEREGFIFDEFSADLNEMLNWKFTGKEFLYWTTQNWSENNLITLSPFANYIKYSFSNSVADDITSSKYEYSLLKADGKPYPIDSFTMSREDAVCTIKTTDANEGLFFATINSVQKEHAMVFKNYTMFNDVIYDTETGYKQRRIKLSGFRTKNWNGDLFSPGFVFDDVKIVDWAVHGTYLPGTVVRYNGKYYEALAKISASATFNFTEWDQLPAKPVPQLLPNFDYKINQFEDFYSLDIDNFDFGQQRLAQHLTGYTPRTYLDNIFTNSISQYKFYQGFIKDKGTRNAIDKLSKAAQSTNKGNITFKEEWAFRVGQYGSYNTFNEIEFPLTENTALENPYIVKFTDSIPTDPIPLINYVTPSSLLLTPTDYISSNTFDSYKGTWEDNNLKLSTAGYVRPDDITSTAYNKNSLLDIANNHILQEGDTIWLGFLENGDWTVYRYVKQLAEITGVFVSAPGSEITFVTDSHHYLSIGDIVSVVRFNEQVNGVYVVTSTPAVNQFTVASTLTTIENAALLNYGALFTFSNARYSNLDDLKEVTDLLKLKPGAKVWVDNGNNNKWQVYEKVKNYSSTVTSSLVASSVATATTGQKFGYSIYANDNSNVMLVSSPAWRVDGSFNWGRVRVYNKNNGVWTRQYDYILNTSSKKYCSSSSSTQFGYALEYDIHKKLYITGAPEATFVRSPMTGTGTVILSTGSGVIKTFTNEGLVKISSRDEDFGITNVDLVLVNPYGTSAITATNSRFGHSIYISQPVASIPTTLLVSAPGTTTFAGPGTVYAYKITTVTNTTTNLTTATITGFTSTNIATQIISTISLTNGSQWGYKIAGTNDGTTVAIGAPGYFTATGVVQLFDITLKHKQTINAPTEFGVKSRFGHDIAISNSKKYLLISAPENKQTDQPYGKVAVYTVTSSGTYVLSQIINNPLATNDLKFGYAISISKDENTIAISALGKNRHREQVYDTAINVEKTTFDNGSTKFFESIEDAGTVYVYNKVGDYFIQADELNDQPILEGSRYGNSVVATNNEIIIGAPTNQSNEIQDPPVPDNSKLYFFKKIDVASGSWKVLREQDDTVDVSAVNRVALIDTLKEEVVDYLDIIDPVKGKIAGLAEQELKYKAAFDPATYSIGLASTIVNNETNWLDEHVGELWWDLSTAKYMWYEQGDEVFRKNNWGRMFPGAMIDVYEWVKSDMLPSEWAALADTTQGLTTGISGQPKYPDNSIISVKQVFNNVTGSFENVYYFWVKNKVTLPNTTRRLSSYQVASYIADPVANGLKFIEIISSSAVAFANVQPMLISNRINANIATNANSLIPKHTEWLLLNEGDYSSVPNTLLEKKLFDSLLGHDSLGNVVPSENLTYRNRYGIGIRPQQTFFKDRLAALRNLTFFVNSVFAANRVVGNYSFENLNKKEEIPALYSYEYDQVVEDLDALSEVFTVNYVQAKLECYSENGKIRSVTITNPGFGYSVAPKVTIVSSSSTPAEITTTIDAQGKVISATIINPGIGYSDSNIQLFVRPHTIIVQTNSSINGKWSKHEFDYMSRSWTTVQTQKYDTTKFWTTVDWVSSAYDSYKIVPYTIPNLSELGSLVSIFAGEYVKVNNIGDGHFAILKKVDANGNYIPSYDIVYKEKGTIQLLNSLWDYSTAKYLYDAASIEETLYDQIPDQELYYILLALKNNIFINSLKVNWNLFFFAAVKFALTEQKLLDWAFKTSFINVSNNIGILDQRPVYKLNNEKYFEEYIKEVKPYHTKIRSYTSVYNTKEQANVYTSDFDLPAYFNTVTNLLTTPKLGDPILLTYPWKNWSDNYKLFVKAIEVGYTGSGYSERPTVIINAAPGDTGSGAQAEAYIRNGKVYKVIVTNPGSGYTVTPLATIIGGGTVTDIARVSVIMDNVNTRKNLIGMKFDRTSAIGELVNTTVTDEFLCDGVTNKFTLTWLASPDKKTITPLLDGKLIFGADYTIEYYQIKVEKDGINIPGAFPRNSWEGERMIDHRYKYFNTITPNNAPDNIRHYAKFVFLNGVPGFDQVLKITYNKNIDLYNSVDRISNMYNPTDLMPGKELPLLMTGVEYSGTQLQGLKFEQAPNWDSTGTGFDSAPWGDTVGSYAKTQLLEDLLFNPQLKVASTDGIFPGQSIAFSDTSTYRQIFKPTTVVTAVYPSRNIVEIGTLNPVDTMIFYAWSTSTAKGSTITIETKESFHDAISAGDYIFVGGVASLAGYGVEYISITTNPQVSTSTAIPTVSVTISPPDVVGGIQATATPLFDLNTATIIQVTNPGMGYTRLPTVTITGTNMITVGSAVAHLDHGYNQFAQVTTCTTNTLQFKSAFTLSSTATVLEYFAHIDLANQIVPRVSSTNKLIDHVVTVFDSATNLVVNTFAPIQNVQRASVYLNSTEVLSTSTNTVWYNLTSSIDGTNRTVVSIQDTLTNTILYGNVDVKLYDRTDIEFYSYNTEYNILDSLISGSSLNDTGNGYKPEDIQINGNSFLNSIDSYAPEECVPGVVRDSLGINVYTVGTPSSPLVQSGVFAASSTGITRAKLSYIPNTPVGFLVYANGVEYTRIDNEFYFNSSTQYAIFGDEIIIPAQPSARKIGYTFITVGSDVRMDSAFTAVNVVTPNGTGTAMVSSLMMIDDVKSVYVIANGRVVPPTTTTTNYGYMLEPVSLVNNRASVKLYGLFPTPYSIEAWFFDSPYPVFNRVYEQFNTVSTSSTITSMPLELPPAIIEPVSEEVIVEKITSAGRYRMLPPWVSYYKIQSGITTFAIDSKNSRPGVYGLDNVKMYLNGKELRPGYDFTVDSVNETVNILVPTIKTGDAIAITSLVDCDYYIVGDTLYFTSSITNATVKVTSFTNHDNMLIRTERFKGNYSRKFTLTAPAINESYTWVTVKNKPLIGGYDYMLLDDYKTIELSEFIDVGLNDDIVIVTVTPPTFDDKILGFRLFKDMFDRQDFHRISKYFSTTLSQPLTYDSDKVYVEDGDHLLEPNPGLNIPGVVYIDGERIEYLEKDGNVLGGLRRSTLGTGPALFSDIGTKVIDQSVKQSVPTVYRSLVQHIPSSTATTYIISENSNTSTFSVNTTTTVGSGIKLSNLASAVDQIEVYYGGRKLRKSSLEVHDKSVSYYNSPESTIVYPPEFSINVPDTVLVTEMVNGGQAPTGSGWVLHETTDTIKIQPGWIMQDANGARYTVVYSGHNSLFNGWGVGFADAITIAWPLTFIEPTKITLNIAEEINTGTRITVIQRQGEFWKDTDSTSLLSSTGTQATFLRFRTADLPNIYFYGGDNMLTEESNALTDENGEPLEGY